MRKGLLKAICLSLLLQSPSISFKASAIKIINGKKYFAYMVQTGETMTSLTTAFKVTEAELLEQNPIVREKDYKPI